MHRGQQEFECRCGAFVNTMEGEQEVLPFPPIEIQNCDEEKRCSDLCEAEVIFYNFPFTKENRGALDPLLFLRYWLCSSL